MFASFESCTKVSISKAGYAGGGDSGYSFASEPLAPSGPRIIRRDSLGGSDPRGPMQRSCLMNVLPVVKKVLRGLLHALLLRQPAERCCRPQPISQLPLRRTGEEQPFCMQQWHDIRDCACGWLRTTAERRLVAGARGDGRWTLETSLHNLEHVGDATDEVHRRHQCGNTRWSQYRRRRDDPRQYQSPELAQGHQRAQVERIYTADLPRH